MRTSGRQLPTAQELWAILSDESQRLAVHYDWLEQNQSIFHQLRIFAQESGLGNLAWLDTYKNIPLEDLVESISDFLQSAKDYIAKNNKGDYREIYESLVVEKQARPADLIFVFGAESNARIAKAIELYKSGLSSRIVISGKGPHYMESHVSEAQRMREFAITQGVDNRHIVIENQAITIPDNVKRTLDLFEQRGVRPTTVLFVASAFVLARASMDWYKFTPWDIEVMPVAADIVDPILSAELWHTTPKGRDLILNEYAKMVLEHKMDLLRLDLATKR